MPKYKEYKEEIEQLKRIQELEQMKRIRAREKLELERERIFVLEGKISLRPEHMADPVLRLQYQFEALETRVSTDRLPLKFEFLSKNIQFFQNLVYLITNSCNFPFIT